MFVHVLPKRALQNTLTAAAAITAVLLLLTYPDAVRTGINRGLSVCGSVIIPTLFPFMLLAGWLADSSLCRYPGPLSRWIARRLFRLPGCCAPAILLGMVGGYPAGMVALSRLHRQGQTTPQQLERMTAFCLCGGPGFIIGTVGIGLMGSLRAGVMLYAAQTVTALGMGIGLGVRAESSSPTAPTPAAPPRRFAALVADTCGTLLTTCGFVTAAAMALSFIEGCGILSQIHRLTGLSVGGVSAGTAALLEVSCGCIALVSVPLAPLWLSLCLSWGGLSVQGQLAALIPEHRLITPSFWGWRLFHGAISGAVAMLLFHLCPPDRSTAVTTPSLLPYSVSAQASAMLLVLCFLAMLCFSEKKTGKSSVGVL